MPTITDADVGQEVASDGILKSVVLTTPPKEYFDDALTLSNGEIVVFNQHLATSAVSSGSVIFAGFAPFGKLVVERIPKGCVVEYELGTPPVLSSLSPDTAVSGDPDFTLSCIGTDFTESTVIQFGQFDEPTTLVSDTEVTTIVKPSLFTPAIVPVSVHQGSVYSDPVDFIFTEP